MLLPWLALKWLFLEPKYLLQQAFLPSELVIDSDHVVEEGDPIGSSGVEGHQASDHPLAGQNERGHVHGEGGVQIFNKKTNHTPICLEDTFFKKEMN